MRSYLILGLAQSIAAMGSFYFYYWTNGYWGKWIDIPGNGPIYRSATAMALAGVVFSQIGNLFTQRASRQSIFKVPLFNNKLIWAGIATELTIIAGIVYLPFLQKFIGTGSFDPKYWLFHLIWIPILPLMDAIRKAIVNSKQKRKGQELTLVTKGEMR